MARTCTSTLLVGSKSCHALLSSQVLLLETDGRISTSLSLRVQTWHIGLFLTMFLGQIGVNGRKQGYYP